MADLGQSAETLSKREMEVALAYASGESYKEIARSLGLSPTTVRTHLRTVYTKLGVTSKIELARFLEGNTVADRSLDHSEVAADLALELDDAIRRERSHAKVLKIISDRDGDLNTVIDAVLDHALEICEAEFGILFEYQGDMKFRELRSRNISPEFAEWLSQQQTFKVEPGTGIGRLASTLQLISIADVRSEDIYQSGAPLRIATADLGKARSFAAIPMISGGRLIGAFTVYRTRLHPFNDRALELASVFADQAVIAIENVRRFQELQHRLERAAATREILNAIRDSRDDSGPVLDVILRHAAQLCDADAAAMTLGREGDASQSLAAAQDMHQTTRALYSEGKVSMNPESSLVARAIVTGKTLHVPDYADTDDYRAGEEVFRSLVDDTGLRTSINVPLLSDGEGIGALVLYRKEVRPYTDDQIALVETFAAQAVIAIENVRQFRELQTRLEREAASREILDAISQSRADPTAVFEIILKNTLKLCHAPQASLSLISEDGTQLVPVAREGHIDDPDQTFGRTGVPLDQPGMRTAAVREKRIIHVDDVRETEFYKQGEPNIRALADVLGARTALLVPLISGDDSVGVVLIYRNKIKPFTTEEIALVETFAAQAAIAIENTRQFREVQERLEREHASAEILHTISQSRDDETPVFKAIVESAGRLCASPVTFLVLLSEDHKTWTLAARAGDAMREIKVGQTWDVATEYPPYQAIKRKEIAQEEDLKETDFYKSGDPDAVQFADTEGIRSRAFVPLIADGVAIGILTLCRREVGLFAKGDLALVEAFAAQAVIAIRNSTQFRELKTRLEREAATREILQVISQSRDDEQPVFTSILTNAQRLCGAPFGNLNMISEDGTRLEIVADGIEPFEPFRPGWSWPIDSGLLVARSVREKAVLQIEDAALDPLFAQGDQDRVTVVKAGVRSVLTVPLISGGVGIGSMGLYRRDLRPFSPDEIALVQTFAEQAVIAIENVRQFKALESRTEEVQALNASLEERVEEQVGEIERMGKLKRFLPAAVADTVVNQGAEATLKSHRALLGVLFCDIRGFTAFCETAEPEETIEVLQTYHEEMGKLINAHGAGVDHRMGDGIMVLFNDPLPCDDPAGDAVRLAIAMRARMADLSKQWKRLGFRLGFGVGVSLGYATVGMVGFEGRFDYTASGTAVNLASRLCDEAEDGEILLSPRAGIAVEDDFIIEPRGEVTFKGIREPVEIFSLKG